MNTFHVIICFLCCSLIVQRLSAQRDTVVIYKKIDTTELKLWIHYPEKVKKRHAAIIFFHGGGWNNGTAEQFLPQSEYLASQGMVAIRASYRLKNVCTPMFLHTNTYFSHARTRRHTHTNTSVRAPSSLLLAGHPNQSGTAVALSQALSAYTQVRDSCTR